jgi:hypothetical protein
MKRVGATGAPAHDVARAPPRGRAVPGSRAHAEVSENPAVRGPRATPLCTRGRDACVNA